MSIQELHSLASSSSLGWPPHAAQIIERFLQASDRETLALSVGLAGDLVVMNQGIASRLLDLAKAGPLLEIRVASVLALGPALEEAVEVGLDDSFDGSFDAPVLTPALFSQIRAGLGALCRDTSEQDLVRSACLRVTAYAPEPWHEQAACVAFRRPESHWRCAAVFAMGRLAGFEPELAAALDSADRAIQLEAVRSVALRGLEMAGPRVLAMAREPSQDPDLRQAAVEALAWLSPPGSIELLRALAQGRDAALRQAAREALGERRAFTDPPLAGAD